MGCPAHTVFIPVRLRGWKAPKAEGEFLLKFKNLKTFRAFHRVLACLYPSRNILFLRTFFGHFVPWDPFFESFVCPPTHACQTGPKDFWSFERDCNAVGVAVDVDRVPVCFSWMHFWYSFSRDSSSASRILRSIPGNVFQWSVVMCIILKHGMSLSPSLAGFRKHAFLPYILPGFLVWAVLCDRWPFFALVNHSRSHRVLHMDYTCLPFDGTERRSS